MVLLKNKSKVSDSGSKKNKLSVSAEKRGKSRIDKNKSSRSINDPNLLTPDFNSTVERNQTQKSKRLDDRSDKSYSSIGTQRNISDEEDIKDIEIDIKNNEGSFIDQGTQSRNEELDFPSDNESQNNNREMMNQQIIITKASPRKERIPSKASSKNSVTIRKEEEIYKYEIRNKKSK